VKLIFKIFILLYAIFYIGESTAVSIQNYNFNTALQHTGGEINKMGKCWGEAASQYATNKYIYSLAVFNDRLYGGSGYYGNLLEWNGTDAWEVKAPQCGYETRIMSLIVYGGKLYGGTALDGHLFQWNGANAWINVADRETPTYQEGGSVYSYIRALAIYGNRIYGLDENSYLLRWNGIDAWEIAAPWYNGTYNFANSLVVFNGKLYTGAGNHATLLEWNGSAWIKKADLAGNAYIYSLIVFNNKLYAGTGWGGSNGGKLLEWNGTDAWVVKAEQVDQYIYSLVSFENELYAGTGLNGYLLKWNGSDAWIQLTTGRDDQDILSLASFNDDIYGGTTDEGLLFKYISSPATIHIKTITELQNMNNCLCAHYILDNDIDASVTKTWNSGDGFLPIGNTVNRFDGTFDGQGHKITNLYINRPSMNYIGLFGFITLNAEIKNLGVENCDITGCDIVGALVGMSIDSTISQCYSTGKVNATYDEVGGLIAELWDTTVSNCYSKCNVQGDWFIGGLIGYSDGLVNKCYSMGKVIGNVAVGGLIGSGDSEKVINCFWDTETSGQATSAGGTGKTTKEMQTKATFTDADWDFDTIWFMWTSPDPFITELSWNSYSDDAKAIMVNVNGKGIIRCYDKYFTELREVTNKKEGEFGLSQTSWTSFPYEINKPYIWDKYIEELRTAAERLCPYLHANATLQEILYSNYGYNNWCNGEILTDNYIWDRIIEEIRQILSLYPRLQWEFSN